MIFLDRSIPKSVAEALKLVRNGDIAWLEDYYAHDTGDEVWIPHAGEQDWLVVSRDKKIRTRSWQRDLIKRHFVGCFIINQKQNPTRWEYLKLLAKSLDEMERIFGVEERPFIHLVDRNGAFRKLAL